MFSYRKRLFYPVYVDDPDPAFGQVLSEHYAGKDSEFSLAAQYLNHRLNIKNRYVRELLGLIAAEEMGHMEMIAVAVSKLGLSMDYTSPFGEAWTSSFVDQSRETLAILEADIQAEERAKDLYLKHLAMARDASLGRMIQFLIKREDVHQGLLQKACKLCKGAEVPEKFTELIYEYKMSLQVLE